MKSVPIYTNKEGFTLAKIEKGPYVEWAVCSNFDDTKEEGNKWSYASYFESFEEAVQRLMFGASYIVWLMVIDGGVYKYIRLFRAKEEAEKVSKDCVEMGDVYIKEYDISQSRWCEVSDNSPLEFLEDEAD